MTVFAPTNDAFAAVPNLDAILKDKNYLTQILSLHLIAGAKVMSGSLKDGMKAGDLTFNKVDAGWQITAPGSTAMILAADAEASNGVVHIIGERRASLPRARAPQMVARARTRAEPCIGPARKQLGALPLQRERLPSLGPPKVAIYCACSSKSLTLR